MNIEMGDLEEALLNLKALGTDKSDEVKLANALILSIQNDSTSAKEIIKGIDQKNKSEHIKSFCKLLSNEL